MRPSPQVCPAACSPHQHPPRPHCRMKRAMEDDDTAEYDPGQPELPEHIPRRRQREAVARRNAEAASAGAATAAAALLRAEQAALQAALLQPLAALQSCQLEQLLAEPGEAWQKKQERQYVTAQEIGAAEAAGGGALVDMLLSHLEPPSQIADIGNLLLRYISHEGGGVAHFALYECIAGAGCRWTGMEGAASVRCCEPVGGMRPLIRTSLLGWTARGAPCHITALPHYFCPFCPPPQHVALQPSGHCAAERPRRRPAYAAARGLHQGGGSTGAGGAPAAAAAPGADREPGGAHRQRWAAALFGADAAAVRVGCQRRARARSRRCRPDRRWRQWQRVVDEAAVRRRLGEGVPAPLPDGGAGGQQPRAPSHRGSAGEFFGRPAGPARVRPLEGGPRGAASPLARFRAPDSPQRAPLALLRPSTP